MTLKEVTEYNGLECEVIGFRYLDSFTMSNKVIGVINVTGEYIKVTDHEDYEYELHFSEIKEIKA